MPYRRGRSVLRDVDKARFHSSDPDRWAIIPLAVKKPGKDEQLPSFPGEFSR
jgi:hypothetical protein